MMVNRDVRWLNEVIAMMILPSSSERMRTFQVC